MKFIIIIFTLILTVSSKNCDNLGILLYEDLGCVPHYKKNSTEACPSKFFCSGLEPWNSHCYFRGKAYQENEQVPANVSKTPCELCTCLKENNKIGFTCVVFECLGPSRVECHMKYTFDRCCAIEEICPPFAICEYNSNKYIEGERFYPENTCLECACSKGFKGKLEEPFCRRRNCGNQLLYPEDTQKGCAPLYEKRFNGTLCCPEAWICGDGSEKILGDGKVSDDSDGCKFGKKMLKIGQKFEKETFVGSYGQKFGKILCECVIPPLVTCNEL